MTVTPKRAESRYYQAADGLRLHMRDYDPGPTPALPLVCLAGLTRNSDDFERLADALSEGSRPRRVVAFDYRGRGLSDHDPDWHHYDLATEREDFLAGLALCGITTAHVLGTSRGGLHIMAMAHTHRAMMRAVILNDIGPVLEPAGLSRIKSYVGRIAAPNDLDAAIEQLKTGAGLHFTGLSADEWQIFARTTFGSDPSLLRLRYDPALAHILDAFDLDKPLPTLWPQFDALRGLPILTIRGAASDLLSAQTCAAMQARWPGCETMICPGQGHAPLLADNTSIARIAAFLTAADPVTG